MDSRHLQQQGSPATVTTRRGEQRRAVMVNHDPFAAIEDLRTMVQGVQAENALHRGQIQDLRTTNYGLQTTVHGLQTTVHGLQTTVALQSGQIQSLEAENVQLRAEIVQLRNDDIAGCLQYIALAERLERAQGLCGVCHDNVPNRRIRH